MEQTRLSGTDTIAAISTPHGVGGVAVIRISGPDVVSIVSRIWKGRDISGFETHTAHLGTITQEDGTALDQAVLTLFRGPRSYTGEDVVELTIHGSQWIQREAMRRLTDAGARVAGPGEFSQRAFLNGRMDLAQTEAVADVISASSRAAHRLAMRQMSGAFSHRLNELREQLIDFASLLELELDFSEEDLEFADRSRLVSLAEETERTVSRLADSYGAGKAFKEGVPVAIAGAPNAGKSTLLNRLLDEDKAIVSDIPGTTRDIIEDTCEIGGKLYRFYDTAGLRETEDRVERIGIERAREQISRAAVVLWLADMSLPITAQIEELATMMEKLPDSHHILVLNKSDKAAAESLPATRIPAEIVKISAKTGEGIEELKNLIGQAVSGSADPETELIVTNARHYQALRRSSEALKRAIAGLQEGVSADFIAMDVREAAGSLSEVVGKVCTPDLLSNIFSKFCVGK